MAFTGHLLRIFLLSLPFLSSLSPLLSFSFIVVILRKGISQTPHKVSNGMLSSWFQRTSRTKPHILSISLRWFGNGLPQPRGTWEQTEEPFTLLISICRKSLPELKRRHRPAFQLRAVPILRDTKFQKAIRAHTKWYISHPHTFSYRSSRVIAAFAVVACRLSSKR